MSQNRISAIVVDDELHARQSLCKALQGYPKINVLQECENGIAAIEAVSALNPQLMFLDIHMPKIDGFDVLELLGDEAPLIVFVTAYDEYAVRAFDNNALDYLLKPLDPKRLEKTIQRIENRLSSEHNSSLNKILSQRQKQQIPLQRILVREGSEVHVILADEIQYIESADDYVAIHTESKTHIKQDRLQNLEQLLDAERFCRIHRSYLLNLNFLASIEAETKDSKVAITKNETRLAISRNGYSRLKNLL